MGLCYCTTRSTKQLFSSNDYLCSHLNAKEFRTNCQSFTNWLTICKWISMSKRGYSTTVNSKRYWSRTNTFSQTCPFCSTSPAANRTHVFRTVEGSGCNITRPLDLFYHMNHHTHVWQIIMRRVYRKRRINKKRRYGSRNRNWHRLEQTTSDYVIRTTLTVFQETIDDHFKPLLKWGKNVAP